jgi:hypothetical protein
MHISASLTSYIPLGSPLTYAEVIPVAITVFLYILSGLTLEFCLLNRITHASRNDLKIRWHWNELIQELSTQQCVASSSDHRWIFVF